MIKPTQAEVEQALEQLVTEGQLVKITNKDGEPAYIENTFESGYNKALKDMGLYPPKLG